MRAVMADPMLEDRHEVLLSYLDDTGKRETVEHDVESASLSMVGMRHALILEVEGFFV